ncbi:MAG TPA: folylpolyglutamate synthase/dihydrofolate synthase family protein [Verrucomicrobiae bacterium]|nr:folylpolyglutamate synthase/dihydrofolate synthase family protein [Verrucomicrobiae bacterium]
MTYLETIDCLYGIRLFGQKLGLETMRQLLRLMGNPQDSLRFIHIAGTNGKGSVAAMTHAALTEAGYKTGLYTSPHLVSFSERFQINGKPIPESDVVRLVEEIRPLIDQVAAHPEFRQPTFFEVVTAIALQYFREQRVEVVVWETGLGGRLDATNVVTPLVSVITNIAFDHMQYLGETLRQIASEKCGIIKPRVPVITAAVEGEALDVIRATAAHNDCPLTIVGEHVRVHRIREDDIALQLRLIGTRGKDAVLTVPLLGEHQAVNCATTVAAIEASGLEVDPEDLRRGLAKTRWPGRFQTVSTHPSVVLDGAHNAAAAERLAATLREHFMRRKLTFILGVLRDKNYDEMCHIFAPMADRIFCVRVNSERTSVPEQLAMLCRAANPQAEVHAVAKLSDAYAAATSAGADVIVVTGSLFLVGEALGRLGFQVGQPVVSDRELVLQ